MTSWGAGPIEYRYSYRAVSTLYPDNVAATRCIHLPCRMRFSRSTHLFDTSATRRSPRQTGRRASHLGFGPGLEQRLEHRTEYFVHDLLSHCSSGRPIRALLARTRVLHQRSPLMLEAHESPWGTSDSTDITPESAKTSTTRRSGPSRYSRCAVASSSARPWAMPPARPCLLPR